MRMQEIVFALCLLTSACTSADKGSDSFAKLMALDDANRTASCLALPSKKRTALFFETQQRHHDYFGFDQCFASSPADFIPELKDEIVARGSVDSLTHYILVIALSRQQGRISRAEIQSMDLPELCKKLAKGSPAHCLDLAEDVAAE